MKKWSQYLLLGGCGFFPLLYGVTIEYWKKMTGVHAIDDPATGPIRIFANNPGLFLFYGLSILSIAVFTGIKVFFSAVNRVLLLFIGLFLVLVVTVGVGLVNEMTVYRPLAPYERLGYLGKNRHSGVGGFLP